MITLRSEAITQCIVAKLNADFRTGGQTIGVIVSDGDVVLVGLCDSDEQKLAAVTIASGTCGVHQVIDQIEVRALRQFI